MDGQETLARRRETIFVQVPPAEAREFNKDLYFFGRLPEKVLTWEYRIVGTRGEIAAD